MSPELKELLTKSKYFIYGLIGMIMFCFDLMALLTIMSDPDASLIVVKILLFVFALLLGVFTADSFRKVIKDSK